MQADTNLNDILISALTNSKAKDVADDQASMKELLPKLQLQNLDQFTLCLQKDCDIAYQIILKIFGNLISSAQSKQILGSKLINQWLLLKIFEAMGILKKAQKAKRQKVRNAFKAFQFKRKKIQQLVKICWKEGDMKLPSEKDVLEIVHFLQQVQKQRINKLFEQNPDKSLSERLNDLIQDYKKMPQESLEKLIQKELILAFASQNPEQRETLKKFCPNLETLNNDIDTLKKFYLKQLGSIPQQILSKLNDKNLKINLFPALCSLKQQHRLINVSQIIRLVQKTKQSENLIKNKNVVLFIGDTGSGKSTLILNFLDYKLQHGNYKGLSTLVPVKQLQQKHKSFCTSPQGKSCTRYINAVLFPTSMYPADTLNRDKNLFICDSPGFGDSAGVQVDIANGVGMINALHLTKSVRVAVILPYDFFSVVGRMENLIKISDTISKIFNETFYSSIIFLFNKVPQYKIKEIQIIVKGKIDDLPEGLQSNEKLVLVLKKILQHSKNPQNFVDPINGDFKINFKTILKMEAINRPQLIQYQFTAETKTKISNFILSQQTRIKDYFDQNRFQLSSYYLKDLLQFKKLLSNHKQLSQSYNKILKYIQQKTKNYQDDFQQILSQIVNNHKNYQEKKNSLRQIREKLQKIFDFFKEFDESQNSIYSKQKLQQIIQSKREQLRAKFQDIMKVSQVDIKSVIIFSEQFGTNLRIEASQMLNQEISLVIPSIRQMIGLNNFDQQMSQKIQKLDHLEILKAKLEGGNILRSLKKEMLDQINRKFTIISRVQTFQFLNQQDIDNANRQMPKINQILKLNFLQNNRQYQKKMYQMMKRIESRCRIKIRQFGNINNLNIIPVQNGNILDNNWLANKSKQIQLLLKLTNIEVDLKEEYQQAKQNIAKGLKQNEQQIKRFINALRGNNSQQLSNNLYRIKKIKNILSQSNKILDNRPEINELVDQIQQQFIQFLKREAQSFRRISVRLIDISQQTYTKIQNYYQKIKNYQNIGLGKRIQQEANTIKGNFLEKIKKPFEQFKKITQNSRKYQQLQFILPRLEIFSIYAEKIESILDNEYDKQLKQEQTVILGRIQKVYNNLQTQIQQFIKFQVEAFYRYNSCSQILKNSIDSQPKIAKNCQNLASLKNILRTLLSHRQNSNFLRLQQKIKFDLKSNLFKTETKLSQIKNYLIQNVKFVKSQDYKFYSQIEDIYKNIRGEDQKFGFKILQKNHEKELGQSLKSDDDKIKQLIRGTNPCRISFPHLKIIYDKYVKLQDARGQQKIQLIITEIKGVLLSIINKLQIYTRQLLDPGFNQLYDFLQCVQGYMKLQKELTIFYQEKHQKYVKIEQPIWKDVSNKIDSLYSTEINKLTFFLSEYDFVSANQKARSFSQLEDVIFQLFQLDLVNFEEVDSTQIDQKDKKKKELIIFIKDKSNELRVQIQNHTKINSQEKYFCKNTKKLKFLFQILKRGQEVHLKHMYENPKQFTIDQNFKRYYLQIEKDTKIKDNIEQNIREYFNRLFNDLRIQLNQFKNVVQLKEETRKVINYLPTKSLKQSMTRQLDDLEKNHQSEVYKQILQLSQIIKQDPNRQQSFLNLFDKVAKVVDQKIFYQRWINQFIEIYRSLQQKLSNTSQIINFIQVNLIKNYLLKRQYQNKIKDIFLILQEKIEIWIKKIRNDGVNKIGLLIQLFKNQIKKLDTSLLRQKQQAQQVFLIYKFLANQQINRQLPIKIINLIQSYRSKLQQELNNVINTYNQLLGKRQKVKIKNEEIINTQKTNTIQKQIKSLRLKGQLFELIEEQLQKQNLFKEKLSEMPTHLDLIMQYEKEVKQMLNFLDDYEFFSDIKRNITRNQLQQDLNTLNQYCQILSKKDKLFNSVILQDQNTYRIQQKIRIIKDKFDYHITQAKRQIEQTFQNINGQPLERVNILAIQLEIITAKQKSFRFIRDGRDSSFKTFANLIKKQFEKIKQKCDKSYKELKSVFKKNTSCIADLQKKKNQLIKSQHENLKRQFDSKFNQKKEKLQQRIKIAKDQNQKKNIQNQLTNQLTQNDNDRQREQNKKTAQIQTRYKLDLQQFHEKNHQLAREFANNLIIFQKALIDISNQTHNYKKYFQQICQSIKNDNNILMRKLIEDKLSTNQEDRRSIGKYILMNNKVFANLMIQKFNKMIQGQKIDYVVKHLEKIGSNMKRQKIQKDHLNKIQQRYKIFKNKYQTYKKRYIQSPYQTTINNMISPLKDLGHTIKEKCYQTRKPARYFQQKMELLAGIFALWAILKSQTNQGIVEFTIQPHPTQITTLILLLGISHPDQNIANRLAQVGTGEGKSIVLSGLCCFLALVGFSVRCACYSAYLSQRDSQSFKSLFQRLGIQKKIKYGTFNELCEDILSNQGRNFKKQIQKMILSPPQGILEKIFDFFGGNFIFFKRNQNQIRQNPTILVIDEVDVFFDENFFGNTYCPAITLAGNQVSSMLNYIWNQVEKKGLRVDLQQILNSQQFRRLEEKYPTLKQLLKNQIHGMIAGALNYKHDYLIIDKKIVYKDGDFITSKMNYGYKTAFANLFQFKNQKISRSNLDESFQINLMIAEFSYAILPTYFRNILGVTGTLQVLPQSKKQQLKDIYNIEDQYVIPSPFGVKKKRNENYYIVPQESYYKQIASKIEQVKHNRPIVIFFKGIVELNEFAASPEYSKYLKRHNTLTEQHQPSKRDSRIIQAVDAGQITLISSAFGRGTDFKVVDDKINENGGLHVIQAFLSLEQSEEVQIKGRTARQNSPGSYDCIINQNTLEQLDIKAQQITKQLNGQSIHKLLLKARQIRNNRLSQNARKRFQDAQKKHQYVIKIFGSHKLSQTDLIQYIYTLNKYPEISNLVIKTVLGLDATGSMSFALKTTCQIIGKTFQRSLAVLESKNCKAAIDIQIKLYRNYSNTHGQILQSTAFQNTSYNLSTFLSKVKPKGGMGNEAIEVFFQSLNQQNKISQVILIGDAPPNTYQQVRQKRSKRGQQYWYQNRFPITNIDKQLGIFVKKHINCPVHSFYLNDGKGFKDISAKTNGIASPFNINSPDVTQKFQAFIVQNILTLIEKDKGDKGLKLVETYRRMFVRNKN